MDTKKRQLSMTDDGGGLLIQHVATGLLVSLATLAAGTLVLAVVQLFAAEFTPSRTVLLLIDYLAVVAGGLVAARRAKRHGFLVGAGVGAGFALIALLLARFGLNGTAISGGLAGAFGWPGLLQAIGGALLFGALAGMIGVNLG